MSILKTVFEKITPSFQESGKAYVTVPKKEGAVYGLDNESEDARRKLLKKFKRAYERVPLINSIIDVQTDQAVQEFYFEGPNSEKLEKFRKKQNLMDYFHKTVQGLLIYGDAFTEVVKDGNEIDKLKILNPIWMNVHREPSGDTIGFSQTIGDKKLVLWGSTGDKKKDEKYKERIPEFDNIIHIKHRALPSAKYGMSVIQPLLPMLNQKIEMEDELKDLIHKYVAPLIHATVGSDEMPAQEADVSDVAEKLQDLTNQSEVTTSHLVDLEVKAFEQKGMDVETPLAHVEKQIITGGHVPPVLLGREGDQNKSAQIQLRSFGRYIKSLQREVKYAFEDKIILGQDLGNEEDELMWGSVEEREWEIDTDIIRGLVTDGIITPQKANDLLPPKYNEDLPDPELLASPRPTQRDPEKMTKARNPNDPSKTTKNNRTHGKRTKKPDRGDKRDVHRSADD